MASRLTIASFVRILNRANPARKLFDPIGLRVFSSTESALVLERQDALSLSLRREPARRKLYLAAPVVLSVGRWVAQERRLPERQLRQTQGWSIIRSGCFSGQELDFLGLGELSPPPRKSARLGLAVVLLQFEKAQEQIPQGGHDVSPFGAADSRSVFAQADVPAVVRAVFTGRPVLANFLQQLLSAVLAWGGAGTVEAVFFGRRGDFALAQFLAFPPYRQKLPAAAQACFLGTEADPLQAPAHQPPVLFNPAGVVFSGKKKAVGA